VQVTADGAVQVTADGAVTQVVVMAAASGSTGGAAVGGTVNVGVFDHQVNSLVGPGREAAGAEAGAGQQRDRPRLGRQFHDSHHLCGRGQFLQRRHRRRDSVVVVSDKVQVDVGSYVIIEAGDSIAIISRAESGLYNIAGSVAVSAGQAGAGATIATLVIGNSVNTRIGNRAKMIAHAVMEDAALPAGVQLPNRDARRRGVVVSATANSTLAMISAAARPRRATRRWPASCIPSCSKTALRRWWATTWSWWPGANPVRRAQPRRETGR
jgi:hypothetical protein